ncbi:MAG: stage II sporulation protein M [Halobacteria archaeon]|nr:stage II sporulation protein M [Halobacteria archaeon]
MRLTDSLRSAYSALSNSTSELLPFYMMTAASSVAARVVPVLGIVASYVVLSSHGRIEDFKSEIEGFNTSTLVSDGELNQTAADSLTQTFSVLVTPESTAVLGVSLVGGVVLFAFVNSVVSAAKINAAYGVLRRSGSPVEDGLRGGASDYLSLFFLFCLEAAVELLLVSVFGGLAAVVPTAAAVLLAPVWLVSALGVHLFFLFAPQAVVVDSEDVFGSLRRNFGFVTSQPVETAVYLIVAVVVYSVSFGLSAVLSLVSATTVATLVVMLGVVPFLDITKTSLYSGETYSRETSVVGVERSVSTRLLDSVRDGLSETAVFVRSHPLLVTVSLGVFVVGLVNGLNAASGIEVVMEPPEESSRLFQNPVGTFFEIGANNWLVGFSQAYSGLAVGVPTLVSLWYNGAVIGGILGVRIGSTAPLGLASLVALLAPHGVLEIPALGVTGGLGLHLGRESWAVLRGRASVGELADEVRRAYSVLVGLLVVFVVASAVESFVTPVVYSVVS